MRTQLLKQTRWGLALVVVLVLAALAPASSVQRAAAQTGPAEGIICTSKAGTNPTFVLTTKTGYIGTPDDNVVFMWGYAEGNSSFQHPSPVLCVNQGEIVTVRLTNTGFNPPVQDEPVSLVFPGQTNVTASMVSGTGNSGLFTLEANPGETVEYTFTAGNAGTYLTAVPVGSLSAAEYQVVFTNLFNRHCQSIGNRPAVTIGKRFVLQQYKLIGSHRERFLHHVSQQIGTQADNRYFTALGILNF